ncbi:hypothetical protein WN943_010096 [Citrus x changshan-huyou]
MELKSCSNEIVIFFLNSQADIGPDYCCAIDIITCNCWPAMLTSLGFTAEEGNILRGYCDASSAPSPGKTSELTLLIDSLKKITRTQVRITKLKNKLSFSQVSH